LGFTSIYSNGFGWTQVYADTTLCTLHYVDNLGFSVLAFFQGTLRTNTNTNLPRARRAFSGVDDDKGFMFVHVNQQLNKRQTIYLLRDREES